MSSQYKKTIILIVSLFLLVTPVLTLAAEYQLMEPSVVLQPAGTKLPDLQTYASWLYNTFFVAIAVAAFVQILIGGYMYVTSSIPGMKQDGKSKIQTALTGLFLALASWLILNTISDKYTNWHLDLENVGKPSSSAGPAGNTAGASSVSQMGGNTGSSNQASSLQEQEVRDRLAKSGVRIESSGGGGGRPCGPNESSGCTNVAGMQESTIQGIENIRKDCPSCTIWVTGGTEHGQGPGLSHGNGYKADFQPNASMDTYFTSNGFKFIGNRNGDNAPQYQKGNVTAAKESSPPHWDVTFK